MKTLIQLISCLGFLSLAACSGQNLTKDNPNGTNSAPSTVNLELDYQEVVHYDCNNNVVSDSVQVVSSPTAPVNIKPNDWTNLGGSKFLNTTTGSTAPMVTGYTSFIIDHGDGALSMHVITGTNVIQYTFYSCDKWSNDGSNTCAIAQTVMEQGTSTINVNYTEKTLPGIFKVNDCPSPSPTPGS